MAPYILSCLGHPPDPPTFQCFLTTVTALTQNTSQISTNEFKHLDPFWVQPSDQPLLHISAHTPHNSTSATCSQLTKTPAAPFRLWALSSAPSPVPSRLGGWSWHLSEEPPLARGCPLFPLKHSLCILPALQGGTLADLLSRIDIWFNKATQNTHCFNSAPTLQLKLTTGQ